MKRVSDLLLFQKFQVLKCAYSAICLLFLFAYYIVYLALIILLNVFGVHLMTNETIKITLAEIQCQPTFSTAEIIPITLNCPTAFIRVEQMWLNRMYAHITNANLFRWRAEKLSAQANAHKAHPFNRFTYHLSHLFIILKSLTMHKFMRLCAR